MRIRSARYIAILAAMLLIGCAGQTLSQTAPLRTDISQPPVASNIPDDQPIIIMEAAPDQTLEEEVAAAVPENSPVANSGAASPGEEGVLDTALELISSSQELWTAGETEKAIEALDNAYALILKTTADGDDKANQQKDDLRVIISKRLLEIYTSRLSAVNGNHKEIPLEVNEHVAREIRSFQTIEREFFIESYQRSGRYRGEMVKAFREAGLPEEITWLPLIESGFKVRALSKARALGLWQFIPSTGYKFGLKRTAWVDERLDPAKATDAAIAYLKELHRAFGDWATVLAAYNCGEGNVFRVLRQQKINYLDNFWDLYQRLPRETARYYPRFLAVLAILKEPAKYGFTLEELDRPLPFETVKIEKAVQLGKVAEKIGCSTEELMSLNAELRHGSTPNSAYELRVPVGMKDELLAGLDSLPTWSPPLSTAKYVYHRVRKGETLSKIAMKYRSSVSKIAEANGLRNKGKSLRAGQKLRIPQRDMT